MTTSRSGSSPPGSAVVPTPSFRQALGDVFAAGRVVDARLAVRAAVGILHLADAVGEPGSSFAMPEAALPVRVPL